MDLENVRCDEKTERAGPVDNGQLRRPSRSPRSQRSRSADVDCLKKYTERRVEERRHTEISDTSKLDTSKWMPLPKNVPRGQQSGTTKRLSRDERQESIDESAEDAEKWPTKPPSSTDNRFSRLLPEVIDRPQYTVRSYSTDMTVLKRPEKSITEQRRHTDCSDPQTIATRWLPHINGAKFYRETSPLARISCEITKSAATRWMTFTKSPSPVPRINPERKDSVTEYDRKDEGSRKNADASKWQPPRKFSPAKNEKGRLQRQDELDIGRDRSFSFADNNERVKDRSLSYVDTDERANKLSERMRDLYDFKTENEWPKRAGTSRENTWISKSSSEEERSNYLPVRRNSQDLEFNDRIDIFKSKAQHEEDKRKPKRNIHNASEVFADEQDERLRKFNDKLRYSEDFSAERLRSRERRTYSDDYDEKVVRRESCSSRQPELVTFKRNRPEAPAIRRLVDKENKRNSDVSMKPRGSQVSYVEIDFTKRDSRTSDASYVSVNLGKRGSVECKGTRMIPDIPPRRAFSQSDERPSTPVPPIEFNDERYVPKKLSEPKRDSTRYKVYLT
ncbi:trichohyalin [Mycetomoellerius zeteki]|uniref:trichohyalin n=1 Tax=Mycetomoellerius zeteki TaxID=64791 RepID=UPI00084E7321|nr:PREDICTED: trichohyalin-like [Trachymyrmex zeteki]